MQFQEYDSDHFSHLFQKYRVVTDSTSADSVRRKMRLNTLPTKSIRCTLLWKHDSQYEKPHILITSKQVSREYLTYLDEKNISYIVAGDAGIDLAAACEALKKNFGIEKLGIVGGPAINTAFLDEGLLDEVIVLIGAGIDGRASFPTVFQREDKGQAEPIPLKLIEARTYDSGAVFIRYKTR